MLSSRRLVCGQNPSPQERLVVFKKALKAVAVGVRPCAADANPIVVAAFAVANNRVSLSRG